MAHTLTRYTDIVEIVGDLLKVRVARASTEAPTIAYDDLALVEGVDGPTRRTTRMLFYLMLSRAEQNRAPTAVTRHVPTAKAVLQH